jgi:hypothetical protein
MELQLERTFQQGPRLDAYSEALEQVGLGGQQVTEYSWFQLTCLCNNFGQPTSTLPCNKLSDLRIFEPSRLIPHSFKHLSFQASPDSCHQLKCADQA